MMMQACHYSLPSLRGRVGVPTLVRTRRGTSNCPVFDVRTHRHVLAHPDDSHTIYFVRTRHGADGGALIRPYFGANTTPSSQAAEEQC